MSRLVVASAIAICVTTAASAQTPDGRSVSDRPGTEAALTFTDLLSLKTVSDVRVNDAGDSVLYVYTTNDLAENRRRRTMVVRSADPGDTAERQFAADRLADPEWSAVGSGILYRGADLEGYGVFQLDVSSGTHRALFYHDNPVESYFQSPDGERIAFLSRNASDTATAARLEFEGAVYDDAVNTGLSVPSNWFGDGPLQVWIYERGSRRKKLVWAYSRRDPVATGARQDLTVAWSPGGTYLAIQYMTDRLMVRGRPTDLQTRIVAVEAASGTVKEVSRPGWADDEEPSWLSDETLVFSTTLLAPAPIGQTVVGRVVAPYTRLSWNTATGEISPITDRPDSQEQAERMAAANLNLSGCSRARRAGRRACVQQNVMEPPEVVTVEDSTWKVARLSNLNQALRKLPLGRVTKIEWTNRNGYRTTNYLVLPPDYKAGRRYPLIVALYSFGDTFVLTTHVTSYPVQMMAHRGIAVLLANVPTIPDSEILPGTGEFHEIENPIASVEAGVDLMIRQGVADSTAIGLMGFSYGGVLTQAALVRSRRFRAGLVVDAGPIDLPRYWISGRTARVRLEYLLADC